MKKFDINPLFLLISSTILLIISILSLNSSYIEKDKKISNINKNIKIIKRYNTLKNTWVDVKKQEKIINNIINQQQIQNARLVIDKNKIKVTIISNTKVLHRFINKLLNEKLNIVRLKLYKDKLIVEVGLL
jgi:hypothetical protein